MKTLETIAAIATGSGGALAIVRMSGRDAVRICDSVFVPSGGKPLSSSPGYTLHHGQITDAGRVIDDVIIGVFRAPHSYTGEDMVEISCHASRYIKEEILKLLIRRGARSAEAGEFTVRAFLSGKIDLSQAEAVADMIASTDKATHAMAANQMRGGYSAEFAALREKLLSLVSLLELELDFSEEDVEFADRTRLGNLADSIERKISSLLRSFSLGNVIKEGVAVTIAGAPNVGKSTLLNVLLNEDRAMVSDIPGTTRDVIEEAVVIDGVRFRFFDTAGLRETSDSLEKMGIDRTLISIEKANIVLMVVEAADDLKVTFGDVAEGISRITLVNGQKLFVVINKIDKLHTPVILPADSDALTDMVRKYLRQVREGDGSDIPEIYGTVAVSAKKGINIAALHRLLSGSVDAGAVYSGEAVVSNVRHYEALLNAREALLRVRAGMSRGIPADLLAQDIREVLHHLGTVTGEITTDEILGSIFSNFCIGK